MKRSLFAVLLLAVLALLNVRVHRTGGPRTVDAQLRHLEQALENGAADDMQRFFPEGYHFTWVLYGLASAQAARGLPLDSPRRAHLLEETQRARAALRTDRARSNFEAEMSPPYGAFYSSWSLYLLAEYVRSAGPQRVPPDVIAAFTEDCDRFAEALAASGSPFLASYPEMAWPADTTPGVAALGIHDAMIAPRYAGLIQRWVAGARARLDPRTGALAHAAIPSTGQPAGGVRGESLALMSRLLVDADPPFAREQYAILREHFLDDLLGLPGMRGYPHSVKGTGDVDSGPLIFGFSGPATVVGAAAARVHGDRSVADALLGTVELLGLPAQFGGQRFYAGGMMPVGDAFLAWARSSPAPEPSGQAWEVEGQRWFLLFHAISAVLAGLLVWWVCRASAARRPLA